MMRCPACNANRNVAHVMGKNNDKDLIGRLCIVCGAHWLGDLFRNKELNNQNDTELSMPKL